MNKPKLLIVDDDEGIVEVVKEFFEEEGHQVYTADSGDDGMRIGHILANAAGLVNAPRPNETG